MAAPIDKKKKVQKKGKGVARTIGRWPEQGM